MASNAEKAVASYQEQVGKPQAPGDWLEVSQERINQFADATLDHQFIHIDPERAAATPFGGTVAHGFLTLSLVPHLCGAVPNAGEVEGLMMGVNYGLNKVRFVNPVPSGSRVRAQQELVSADLVGDNAIQLTTKVTIEIDGVEKPACVAETLSRLFFS